LHVGVTDVSFRFHTRSEFTFRLGELQNLFFLFTFATELTRAFGFAGDVKLRFECITEVTAEIRELTTIHRVVDGFCETRTDEFRIGVELFNRGGDAEVDSETH
jgi:hypothetical protein